MHELTQIMRQKDDLAFAELLNRLRENEMTEKDFEILDARVVKTDESNYPSTASHLFVENNLVDSFNLQYIAKLSTEKVQVAAFVTVQVDVSAEKKES